MRFLYYRLAKLSIFIWYVRPVLYLENRNLIQINHLCVKINTV